MWLSLQNEKDLITLLNQNPNFEKICHAVKDYSDHDLYLSAGAVRNTVWSYLHDHGPLLNWSDADIIFLNRHNLTKEYEKELERYFTTKEPDIPWSFKNQLRMAEKHGHSPYSSIEQAISKWVETATAIAIGPLNAKKFKVIAPYGLEDLYSGILRPTSEKMRSVMDTRIHAKKWLQEYPLLRVF